MDPTLNTSTSSSFLGGLGDLTLGFLAQRANLLLSQESGGNVVSYNPSQYAPSKTTGSFLAGINPMILIVGGVLLAVAMVFAFKAAK